MSDRFDPYREALVIEQETVWPEELASVGPAERRQIEAALHADPARAAEVDYVRLYSGFCRRITVAPADVERLAPGTLTPGYPLAGASPKETGEI